MERLLTGYRQFYQHYFVSDKTLYQTLSQKGQSPETLMISCSDSRVDPALLTQARPGDLFILRNIANLVPRYEPDHKDICSVGAVLEFAVCILRVRNIIVLGHSQCAGVKAMLEPDALKELKSLCFWMNFAEKVKKRALKKQKKTPPGEEFCSICEQENIVQSLENLQSYPLVHNRIRENQLRLYGWYFIVSTGILQQYNVKTECFEAL